MLSLQPVSDRIRWYLTKWLGMLAQYALRAAHRGELQTLAAVQEILRAQSTTVEHWQSEQLGFGSSH